MAVNDVFRPNVDYTLGTQVTSPVSGKTAFVPTVQGYTGGTPFGVTIVGPLGVQAVAESAAVTSVQLPASLGIKTAAASFSVTGASDGYFKIRGITGTGTNGFSNGLSFLPDESGVGRLLGGANFLANSFTASPTWDLQTGNVNTTVGITATGVTTTQTGADQTNYNGRGVIVVLDMTNVGTGSVTIAIQGKDSVSGKYYTLLTGAAVATNSTNVYTVYPGVTVAANVSASAPLPRTWRVVVTANNANATTYTVGASVLL